MSAPQRIAAAVVLIIVVLAVGTLALLAARSPIGVGPPGDSGGSLDPAPSGERSPGASGGARPSASAEPTSRGEAELLAELAEIEAQVIAIRGLEAADVGPADLITRAELGEELQALFDKQYPPAEREEDNLALRALGLLGPDEDVAELQLQLLGDQVLGFYDTTDKRMVVVTDAGLDPMAKLTYAHEYTHALQDAAFAPPNFDPEADLEDDQGLALASVTEGDATVTMLAWALAHLSQEELIEAAAGQQLPDTTGIPSWMVAQLQFPYTSGSTWAGVLTGGDPLRPEFNELDAAYADLPESTEQIIHQDAWESREAPLPVAVPDLVEMLGDGWEEVDDTSIGEASVGIMLRHFGVAAAAAGEASQGWGGDRVRIAVGPEGAFAVAWRLAWDTPADAAEFVSAYEIVVGELPFPALVSAIGSDEVLVVHASDDVLLRQVAGAAD